MICLFSAVTVIRPFGIGQTRQDFCAGHHDSSKFGCITPQPAYHERIRLPESLATIWAKKDDYFADDILRIRLRFTIFGKVVHDELAVNAGEKTLVQKFTEDMLVL